MAFKMLRNGYDEWEISDTQLEEEHKKGWVDLPPRTNVRSKS